ncbi:hypothetical protein D3C77_801410 [compost metagenome]
MVAAGGAVVDHEVVAAIGFDHISEGGEGFFGQGLDHQGAHADISSIVRFLNEVRLLLTAAADGTGRSG